MKQLLARQAEWQKARRLLAWPEKLRLAEEMRETLLRFEALRASETRQRRVLRPVAGAART